MNNKETKLTIITQGNEIKKLWAVLRQQIMTYQVDDQAWDREADADRIMARLLAEYDSKQF